jgi:citrate lyase subunit beta/citryl-CoA lyase
LIPFTAPLLVPAFDDAAPCGAAGARALILDLAGADEDMKAAARAWAASQLARGDGVVIIVRVNGLLSGHIEADLAMLAPLAPDAVLLPDCHGGDDAQHVSVKLKLHEAEAGLAVGSIGLIACVGASAALFRLGSYCGATQRLQALTWSARDLALDVGAQGDFEGGALSGPMSLARNLTLFAATAARVKALDGPYEELDDLDGLRRICMESKRDGFAGKIALSLAQMRVIEDVFG